MNMKRCISIIIFCLVIFFYSFVSAHWETKEEINTTKKFVKINSTEVLLKKLIQVPKSWESLEASMIIEELGNREDEKALPVLKNILETCSDVFICAQIKIAIEKIKMKDKGKNEKVLNYINLLEDKNTFVVNMTADILEELGSKEAIPALKAQEYRSLNCQKARIKLQLEGQNETKKLNLLIEAKEISKTAKEWIEIARKIEKIDQSSNLKEIVTYLDDKEPRVRKIAAEKIGIIGNNGAIIHLERTDTCWLVKQGLRQSKEMIEIKKELKLTSKTGLDKKQLVPRIKKITRNNPSNAKILMNLFLEKGWMEELKQINKDVPEMQTLSKQFEFCIGRARTKHLLDITPKEQRIKKAMDLLINWKSVFEYEAAILTLIDIGNEIIPNILNLLKENKNIPTKDAPPYERIHTNFSILLTVLKSIPEDRSIQILQRLLNSKVSYVSKEAKETLEWVKSEVPYPFKYERTLFIALDDISLYEEK